MAKTSWVTPEREVSKGGDTREAERRRTNEGSGVTAVLREEAGKDEVAGKEDKLEVKLNGSWYAANLSLEEDGSTRVHYDSYTDEEDDERWDAKKIKSFKPLREHIRVISEPLQDEECGLVHVKKIVCALRKAGGAEIEGWHNSLVTSVEKRDHAKGENCTCSFRVVWLDGPHIGQTRTVGCGEICLLSPKDVQTHPLILDLLCHADQEDKDDEWIPEDEQVRQCKRLKLKGPSIDRKKRGQVPFLNSNFSDGHRLRQGNLRSKSSAGPSGKYHRNRVEQEVRNCPNTDPLQEQSSEEGQQPEFDSLRHANQGDLGSESKEREEVLQVTKLKSNFDSARVKEESHDSSRLTNQGEVGSERKEREEVQVTGLKSNFDSARVKEESHDSSRLTNQGEVGSERKEREEVQVTGLKSDFDSARVKAESHDNLSLASQGGSAYESKEQQLDDRRAKRPKAESKSAWVKAELDANIEPLCPVNDYFAPSSNTGLQGRKTAIPSSESSSRDLNKTLGNTDNGKLPFKKRRVP